MIEQESEKIMLEVAKYGYKCKSRKHHRLTAALDRIINNAQSQPVASLSPRGQTKG